MMHKALLRQRFFYFMNSENCILATPTLGVPVNSC